MVTKPSISIDASNKNAPTRDHPTSKEVRESLPKAKATKTHPKHQNETSDKKTDSNNASLFFVGTATTILEWEGLRLMTDPNFLHAGDHVHLGPGVTGTRRTNPAVDLHDLPPIDLVLLSHYHADHFDEEVEAALRRDLPIITTPHAHACLTTQKSDEERFTNVHALDKWDNMFVDMQSAPPKQRKDQSRPRPQPRLRVEGMPGKHVGDGLLSRANDILGAVPPTNGWMLELGYDTPSSTESSTTATTPTSASPADASASSPAFQSSYRIYISGDTLNVDELSQIPEHYTHAGKPIDLMLIHLGGTTIPGPSMPLLMVTMDAKQGVALVKLVQPDVVVPIHYDDYDVFLSPLADFQTEMTNAGLDHKAVYLDRGDEFRFEVQRPAG
ncbi:hypothetical protein LTR84_009965 [Exophiala bonariae]|uniref:Metallo-beta-lactamase domain-containing protein n=1 Tax=Exophiala bonariae TaxID=1690606 RepID=A0AAV9NK51_9EURO|nr:hypothetical protein LTR84_009965 [Exophiala bonariae]